MSAFVDADAGPRRGFAGSRALGFHQSHASSRGSEAGWGPFVWTMPGPRNALNGDLGDLIPLLPPYFVQCDVRHHRHGSCLFADVGEEKAFRWTAPNGGAACFSCDPTCSDDRASRHLSWGVPGIAGRSVFEDGSPLNLEQRDQLRLTVRRDDKMIDVGLVL